jgi:transcriptional regulator with XRE-family HTH domain
MLKRPLPKQRKALGLFLASRRARLQPDELGLPPGSRRTPGLRREEVAVLAGVSVSWYTWLEQGRDIQASADTLRRVSEVLRLDRAEVNHLFALAAREPPQFAANVQISEGLNLLVQAMDPVPAYIRNTRLDILAWNKAIADLFVDYGKLAVHERNTLRLLFLHRPYRTLILDWEQMARGMLSIFHAAQARAHDKAPFDTLIEELNASSREFRSWWPDVDALMRDANACSIRSLAASRSNTSRSLLKGNQICH